MGDSNNNFQNQNQNGNNNNNNNNNSCKATAANANDLNMMQHMLRAQANVQQHQQFYNPFMANSFMQNQHSMMQQNHSAQLTQRQQGSKLRSFFLFD